MSEVTTGARAVLSHPIVYEVWSRVVGGRRGRSALVREYVRPAAEARVLDLGCGPGELLEYLPESVNYLGVDISPRYIARARARFGARAEFRNADATVIDDDLRDFDLVLAFGLLHHLDDAQSQNLFRGAERVLKPGGRTITVDPTLTANQSRAARAVIGRDRGQHVRAPEAYVALATPAFSQITAAVRTDLLRIPYTHCILECEVPMVQERS